jgi:hypothetical protein
VLNLFLGGLGLACLGLDEFALLDRVAFGKSAVRQHADGTPLAFGLRKAALFLRFRHNLNGTSEVGRTETCFL